ncbi:MAG: DUF3179 domain-containing protein [Candidatus Woesearchaeota archaeon]|nr:DUF3179 domain-containing protein [Candidatus Woesearchaeota archaeon]
MHIVTRGVVFVLGLILIAAATLMFFRPTHELPDSSQESTYLDYIADNLAHGGVRKDGIPAIDTPLYITPEAARNEEHLGDDELIFGVHHEGKTLAIPQKILYWHEIVNEEGFSVTYCPLTGTVIGYEDVNLGVSGKLYNSNLVMYDRKTDSYYPQMLGTAVTGPEKGTSLTTFPVAVTTFGQWTALYPETQVLSQQTGHARDYDNPPYQGYEDALRLYFAVAEEDDRYHTKRMVHGILYKGKAYTVLKEELGKLVYDTGDGILTITQNTTLGSIDVVDDKGSHITHYDAYWFAWYAYNPETIVVNP